MNQYERNAMILSKIYKSLKVYVGNNAIQLEPPTNQSLRDYVAEQFEIFPTLEDQEYTDDQRWAIDSKLIELREYIMHMIVS